MTINKIYFDLDGVLADFDRAVLEICKIQPMNQAKSTAGYHDILFTAMSKIPHFYGSLELMPGARELFHAVYEKYGDKCEILSGIPKPKRNIQNAGEDKKSWVHRLLDTNVVVNVVYRADKVNFCKGPEYVLIDDFAKNIKEWEAMGGTGIHHTNPKSTMEELRRRHIL